MKINNRLKTKNFIKHVEFSNEVDIQSCHQGD